MEIVTIHLGILVTTALVILYSDHQAFDYMRGKKSLLSFKTVKRAHHLVWAGLLGMITTGVLMIYPVWQLALQNPIFLVKMGFVLVLVVNAIFIGHLLPIASTVPFNAITPGEKKKLMISGALSTIGWLGAATVGLFFL